MDFLVLQARTMAAACLAGLLVGLLYDCLSLLRALVSSKRQALAVWDLTFWLSSTAMTYTILMHANRGDVRLFVLAVVALGYGLYRATLRHIVQPVLALLEKSVRRAAHRARRAARWSGRVARSHVARARAIARRLRKATTTHCSWQGFRRRRRTIPEARDDVGERHE
ncbi:MAG: spore cortex biosynthesis protein YabQ [Clostridia bacterium]|nr:spore cortex biosynthesis protein YabQ [Clostridia bacterium]